MVKKQKANSHLESDEEEMIKGVRMGQAFALAKESIEMPSGDKEERDRY